MCVCVYNKYTMYTHTHTHTHAHTHTHTHTHAHTHNTYLNPKKVFENLNILISFSNKICLFTNDYLGNLYLHLN